MTTHRTGVMREAYLPSPYPIFAYISHDGHLDCVIDSKSLDDAWLIATGWGDQTDITQRKRQGWKLIPCIVEWEDVE